MKTLKTLPSAFLAGVLSLTPAMASGTWTADVGLGGAVAPGAWTPLRVTIPANVGPWTLEVRTLSASGRESNPVVYTRPVGGVFEMPVFLTDAARSLNLRFFTNQLVQQELTLGLTGRIFPGHLIGVDGLGPGARAALSEVLLPQEPVKVVPVSPAQWPISPLSLSGFSALAAQDPGPVLSPAQVSALRAWVGSGGRLVLVGVQPGAPSLVTQLGEVPGVGLVKAVGPLPTPGEWAGLLDLKPYGQVRRLGTDFDPPALNVPGQGSSTPMAHLVFLAAWGGLMALVLGLRPKGGLGLPLVASVAAGAIAVVVFWTTPAWDRGLPVHGREVILPADLGRFTSVTLVQTNNPATTGWPKASPWALATWQKDHPLPDAFTRFSSQNQVVFDSFLPPLKRTTRFLVNWEDGALRWTELRETARFPREEGPVEFEPDRLWLTKLASGYPGFEWSVGLDGTTCWVRPEPKGGRL